MKKIFKLVRNSAFGSYYLENENFIPKMYEMETFGDNEYYTDSVVFTGTIKEIVNFFIETKKNNLMKGWGVTNLSTQDIKWINNEALSLVYQYKYLIGEISEC
jgi:hypothetical protein